MCYREPSDDTILVDPAAAILRARAVPEEVVDGGCRGASPDRIRGTGRSGSGGGRCSTSCRSTFPRVGSSAYSAPTGRKSTAMRVLLGLQKASAGTVRVLGHEPGTSGFRDAARRVGSIIESPPLYRSISAIANLEIRVAAMGLSSRCSPEARRWPSGSASASSWSSRADHHRRLRRQLLPPRRNPERPGHGRQRPALLGSGTRPGDPLRRHRRHGVARHLPRARHHVLIASYEAPEPA